MPLTKKFEDYDSEWSFPLGLATFSKRAWDRIDPDLVILVDSDTTLA